MSRLEGEQEASEEWGDGQRPLSEGKSARNSLANRVQAADQAFHNWYRFVLSFPPHLVRDYFHQFEVRPGQVVLDPFCGTGTTVVEAKLNAIASVGIEANPMAYFASTVKTDWAISSEGLLTHGQAISTQIRQGSELHARDPLRSLPEAAHKLLLKNSIDPLPLHKALVLLSHIDRDRGASPYWPYERLALAKAVVGHCSNLSFGPEVGVRARKRNDAPVLECWFKELQGMAADLANAPRMHAHCNMHHADARSLKNVLEPASIDAVFTSPPYPNEKDYTRATRLETILLGFVHSREDLRALKQGLLRSNTRNVYKADTDDRWVVQHPEIQQIAEAIEQRRLDLGKTSGFERLYARATRLYFGGMARHFAALRPYLKPGARLGYVVGDQASYLQVMIRTGQLLADIAAKLGYQVVSLDLFRTRLATMTRQQMREEVLFLRWPG